MRLIVKDNNGTERLLETRQNVSAITKMELKRELQSVDTVSIEVVSARPLTFNIGDCIEVEGGKYFLNKQPTVRKTSTKMFTYTMDFEGVMYKLITVNFLLMTSSDDRLMLNSFVGNLADFVDMVVLNANRVYGAGTWAVGNVPASTQENDYTKRRCLTFKDCNCLQVLQGICEEWEVEFTIREGEGGQYIIDLAKEPDYDSVQIPAGHTFSYGRTGGLVDIERKPISSDIITRLYLYGGSQNLPAGYITERGTNRLCLRRYENHNTAAWESYVENNALKAIYGVREAVEELSDIFPQRTGRITQVVQGVPDNHGLFKVKDATMAQNSVGMGTQTAGFDLMERDSNGAYKYYTNEAKMVMQTGDLAGYAFDIVGYDHGTQTFTLSEIVDENELHFPSAESTAFRIQASDTYILTGIMLPESYVMDAEFTLAEEATRILTDKIDALHEYSLNFDRFYLERHSVTLNVGGYIGLYDEQLGIKEGESAPVKLRITAMTKDLINRNKYALTIQTQKKKWKKPQFRGVWRVSKNDVVTDMDVDIPTIGYQYGQLYVEGLAITPNYKGSAKRIFLSPCTLKIPYKSFDQDTFSPRTTIRSFSYGGMTEDGQQVWEGSIAMDEARVYLVLDMETGTITATCLADWQSSDIGDIDLSLGRWLYVKVAVFSNLENNLYRTATFYNGATRMTFRATEKLLLGGNGIIDTESGEVRVPNLYFIENGSAVNVRQRFQSVSTEVSNVRAEVMRNRNLRITNTAVAEWRNGTGLSIVAEGTLTDPFLRESGWMLTSDENKDICEDITGQPIDEWKDYMVYAQAGKDDPKATIVLSQSTLDGDEFICLGMLHAKDGNGQRMLNMTYGGAITNGSFVRGGVLRNEGGDSVIDLDRGVVSYKLGNDWKDIKEVIHNSSNGLLTVVGETANTGLRKRMGEVEDTVGNANAGLVKRLADVEAVQSQANDLVNSLRQNILSLNCALHSATVDSDGNLVISFNIPNTEGVCLTTTDIPEAL